MGSEQRQSPRFEMTRPLIVMDQVSNESLGLLVNLSSDGLMLLGERPVRDGSVYQATIVFSQNSEIRLDAGIECLWSSEADSANKHWAGFRIIDIAEDKKDLLNSVIAELSQA